jgi:hypothetical protein
VLPTLLGNALRRAEDTAGQRYGLDSVAAFPRIFPSLSKPLDAALAHETNTLDSAAALTAAFGLCTVISLPLVFNLDLRPLIPLAAALLTAVAYRGAIHAAHQHGVLVATAFDLHRFDMLDSMRIDPPKDPTKEFELNQKLSALLTSAGSQAPQVLHNVVYAHPLPQPNPATVGQGPGSSSDKQDGGASDNKPEVGSDSDGPDAGGTS